MVATAVASSSPIVVGADGAHVRQIHNCAGNTYEIEGSGPYTVHAATAQYAAVAEVGPAVGNDRLTLDDRGAVEFHTAASRRSFKVQLAVRGRDENAGRTITVKGSTTRVGSARLEITADRTQVIYRHTGTTTRLTFELSTAGAAPAMAADRHALPPIVVEDGDVVTLHPDWSALDARGGSLQIRKRMGWVQIVPLR